MTPGPPPVVRSTKPVPEKRDSFYAEEEEEGAELDVEDAFLVAGGEVYWCGRSEKEEKAISILFDSNYQQKLILLILGVRERCDSL